MHIGQFNSSTNQVFLFTNARQQWHSSGAADAHFRWNQCQYSEFINSWGCRSIAIFSVINGSIQPMSPIHRLMDEMDGGFGQVKLPCGPSPYFSQWKSRTFTHFFVFKQELCWERCVRYDHFIRLMNCVEVSLDATPWSTTTTLLPTLRSALIVEKCSRHTKETQRQRTGRREEKKKMMKRTKMAFPGLSLFVFWST